MNLESRIGLAASSAWVEGKLSHDTMAMAYVEIIKNNEFLSQEQKRMLLCHAQAHSATALRLANVSDVVDRFMDGRATIQDIRDALRDESWKEGLR